MFVNNVTCLQQQQPLAIHYDMDHSQYISIGGTLGNVHGGGVGRSYVIVYNKFVLDMM